MKSHRTTSTIVGLLFLVATVFFVTGGAIYDSVLSSPDYLDKAHPDRMSVISGILIELIGILAIPLIPVFLFPILKNRSEALALGYLVFRTLEAALLIIVAFYMLSLIDVSQDYLAARGTDASYFHTLGSSIHQVSNWAFLFSVGIIFPLGALVLYSLLYGSRLVPRFISVWGLLAAALLLTGSVLDMFGVFFEMSDMVAEAVLAGPIAVNEIVLAIWLILKGFNPAALTGESVNAVSS